MTIQLDVNDNNGNDLVATATLYHDGIVEYHSASFEESAHLEVVEAPEFRDIWLTDEGGNTWKPTGKVLELVEDCFFEDWLDLKTEG